MLAWLLRCWYVTTLLGRKSNTWWRHQMETFSALLAICAGNSLVIGEFPAQRPLTRSFDVFFDLHLNKWLSKQSWGWWFETPLRPLWRHCNVFGVGRDKLLHSSTPLAIWLSVGYQTWPSIGWHHPLVIGCLNIGWDCLSRNSVGFFSGATDTPLAQPWWKANPCL